MTDPDKVRELATALLSRSALLASGNHPACSDEWAVGMPQNVCASCQERWDSSITFHDAADALEAAAARNTALLQRVTELENAVTTNHGCRECAADVGVLGASRAGLCSGHAEQAEQRNAALREALERVSARYPVSYSEWRGYHELCDPDIAPDDTCVGCIARAALASYLSEGEKP